mgnify:CR=1 FL=1|tara:strand:+ start:4216 stop:4740 length:525 start_codon:yes stop_codon:yes gene_type:complete
MNGDRKIGPSIKPDDFLIHPIFLTRLNNTTKTNQQPIVPEIKNNKIIFTKKSDNIKELNNLASFMEKPYTSVNSILILQLKKINNIVDIEEKLKNNEFKTDSEFRYYFNLFVRKNLRKMSKVQFGILISFLLNYFKNKDNINQTKIENIVNKWKDKNLEEKFYYNFIEYIEKKN